MIHLIASSSVYFLLTMLSTRNGSKMIGKRKWTYISSNHFVDGEPASANPNPSLFLNLSDKQKKSEVKQRQLSCKLKNELKRPKYND